MPLRAFVTGGTGFLGLNLVEQLTSAGWQVTALHRKTSDISTLSKFPVTLVEGSIEDANSIQAAMPNDLDAVFHVAADVNFWKGFNDRQTRTNIDGTRNVVQAALERKVKRFIHTSTVGIYFPQSGPFDETAPKNGQNSWINYVRTKFEAHKIVLDAIPQGLDAVILNPSNIVGRYDKTSWGRMFGLIEQNKLPGLPNATGPFCWAEEVAKAELAAYHQGKTGENYLLAGTDATYHELATIIAKLIGKPAPRKLPRAIIRLAANISNIISTFTRKPPDVTPELAAFLTTDFFCKSDKAERELGYRPVPLQLMLEDSHQWLVSQGLAKAASEHQP